MRFRYFATVKKIISYIFLTIFTLQVLPVKEIGKILYKGMMTEEIHEVETEGKAGDGKTLKWKPLNEYYVTADNNRALYFTTVIQIAIHQAENLPDRFVPDITTPPPNVC